jgi:hypothetical protein
MHSFPSKYVAFAFVPTTTMVAAPHCVFMFDSDTAFAILQSRTHECWAHFFSSSHEDRIRYTITDCFETFAFPEDWEQQTDIATSGAAYYSHRTALMIRNSEGLTDTYNRFHDPDETSPDILQLRTLHAAMDHAVLSAYGWHDLAARATCEFQLDYEEPEDEDDEAPSKRKKKKPWRYKWPQDLHDEVLARLLELNQQYAEAERLAGEAAQTNTAKAKPTKKAPGKKTSKKKTSRKSEPAPQIDLYRADDPSPETDS